MKKILYGLFLFFLIIVQVSAADKALLKVNTEGNGQIVVVSEKEEIVFNEEYPFQSAFENTEDGKKFKIGAKGTEDWEFVKWTLNGEDYSTDPIITIEIKGDMGFIAVFEPQEKTDVLITPEENKPLDKDSMFLDLGIGIIVLLVAMIGIVLSRRLIWVVVRSLPSTLVASTA